MTAKFTILLALLCGLLSLCSVLAGTSAEGLAYLEAKGKEEGVVTLPSGLLYKEIRPGNADGKTPTINSPCECDYSGALIDGTEFDSSYKRGQPLTFAPNQVIKGWTEAMQLMKEGAKWELYIPSELGYGDRGAGADIPGGAVLVFTLELLKVKGDYVKEDLLSENLDEYSKSFSPAASCFRIEVVNNYGYAMMTQSAAQSYPIGYVSYFVAFFATIML